MPFIFLQYTCFRKICESLQLINNIYYEQISDDELTIPIGDPLHLWKHLRSKFQMYSIDLFENSPYATDYQKVKNYRT